MGKQGSGGEVRVNANDRRPGKSAGVLSAAAAEGPWRLSASARPGTSVVTTLVPLLLIFLLTRGREVYAGMSRSVDAVRRPSSTRSQVQPLVFL